MTDARGSCSHRQPVGDVSAEDLGAFVRPPSEGALEWRRPVEQGSSTAPLRGLSLPIKDNVDVAGWPTRAGSNASVRSAAASDAELVKRLREAGAGPALKTSLDEFAFTTYGPDMRNPHDLSRTVGGSSGGSAIAVAAGGYCVAIGTDTGGSVRIPASYCGIVGFKPSYDHVPIAGVVPLSWSLDHVGFLGCGVEMVKRVFDVCREKRSPGRPPLTGTDTDRPRYWPRDLAELRIGVPSSRYLSASVDEVSRSLTQVSGRFRQSGCSISEVPLPEVRRVLEIHYPLVMVEAAAYHQGEYADLSAHGGGVRETIEAGLKISAGQYITAVRGKATLEREISAAFAEVDVLLLPTTPTPAWSLDEESVVLGDESRVSRLDASIWYTATFNDVGFPAISLPDLSNSLPVGLQLVAAKGDDDLLLSVASRVEEWVTHRL